MDEDCSTGHGDAAGDGWAAGGDSEVSARAVWAGYLGARFEGRELRRTEWKSDLAQVAKEHRSWGHHGRDGPPASAVNREI